MNLRCKIIDVGDETNNSNRNGPEDNESGDSSGSRSNFDKSLPPLQFKVRPDDLARSDPDITRGHVERLVVSKNLKGDLCGGLRSKFNECGVKLGSFTVLLDFLKFFDFRNQFSKLSTAPINGVNLFRAR